MTQSEYQVLGRLLGCVGRFHATRADQAMAQVHLYRSQAFLLMTLSVKDGMTHSEIAQRLEISPAAATKVIKRLEQAQYLQRRPDPNDERVSRVYLRDEGRAVIDEIHRAFDRLDRLMLDGLTLSDREKLRAMLTHMLANLQRIQPDSKVT